MKKIFSQKVSHYLENGDSISLSKQKAIKDLGISQHKMRDYTMCDEYLCVIGKFVRSKKETPKFSKSFILKIKQAEERMSLRKDLTLPIGEVN